MSQNVGRCVCAVSYTHLDVYKRQRCTSVLIVFGDTACRRSVSNGLNNSRAVVGFSEQVGTRVYGPVLSEDVVRRIFQATDKERVKER